MKNDIHLKDECVKCEADLKIDYDEDHDMYEELKREKLLKHCREEHSVIFKLASTLGKIIGTIKRFKAVVFR